MLILSRKSVLGAFALVAALSAPLAFAQSANASVEATPTATTAQTESSAQATTEANQTTATTATETSAAPTAAPAKKSWADVDADKNGKLTKAEAGTVPALAQVFDQADGNADGALTADEYKAYAAQLQGGNQDADGSK